MSIVIICFLLAGYSVQSGSMIYTDVFSSMFGVRGRALAQLLSAVLGILFFGLIVWGSYEPMLHAWFSGEYEGEGRAAGAGLAGPGRRRGRVCAGGRQLRIASRCAPPDHLSPGEPDNVATPTASTHI